MRFVARLILAIVVNAVALLITAYFVPGFRMAGNVFLLTAASVKELLGIALVLTLLNFVVKPFLLLIMGPVIALTLGLGYIIVNAIILYLVEVFSPNLTITGVAALFWAALIIGGVNALFHLATKK